MTRLVSEKGQLTAVTLVDIQPNTVTEVKDEEKHGYDAIQIATTPLKKETKTKKFKHLREVPCEKDAHKKGDILDISSLKDVKEVQIVGVSKGKGFQGAIKRHNFSRGPMSHGSKYHRWAGSMGTCNPVRTKPGKKMAGRMGNDKITLKKVPVMKVDTKLNLVALKGPLPGKYGSLILMKF